MAVAWSTLPWLFGGGVRFALDRVREAIRAFRAWGLELFQGFGDNGIHYEEV